MPLDALCVNTRITQILLVSKIPCDKLLECLLNVQNVDFHNPKIDTVPTAVSTWRAISRANPLFSGK